MYLNSVHLWKRLQCGPPQFFLFFKRKLFVYLYCGNHWQENCTKTISLYFCCLSNKLNPKEGPFSFKTLSVYSIEDVIFFYYPSNPLHFFLPCRFFYLRFLGNFLYSFITSSTSQTTWYATSVFCACTW
jgi:hypothetical protein